MCQHNCSYTVKTYTDSVISCILPYYIALRKEVPSPCWGSQAYSWCGSTSPHEPHTFRAGTFKQNTRHRQNLAALSDICNVTSLGGCCRGKTRTRRNKKVTFSSMRFAEFLLPHLVINVKSDPRFRCSHDYIYKAPYSIRSLTNEHLG